ncbi:EI24 domain-containing protein [Pollutimonas bauzanensis]|uniref:Etoposide-induced protein 2.4 (EI24) n=1 Tax=Pollutimonas bauzanensis TaxID=658167 RepID=A0A1M5X2K2_9BURK|nr:EI24 domain-containing protein [Pollutimonas bauzanensis]SHH94000.1 Etoposide-induced protein 2.4 (EI24) [Pollutimonas bauzanensis]
MSNNFNLAVRARRPAATGMSAVGVAFKRALVSQCHPKMLAALLLPFIIALLGAIILLWAFWEPLTGWLNSEAANWEFVNQIDQWMLAIGLFSIKLYLIPLLAAGILLPMSGILGLVIAAVFVMPIVLRHLEAREYRGLTRQGQYSTAVGAWNAVWVGVLFVLAWLLTMPLWLIPPLPMLLPVVLWAFAFTRMLRVDAIVEHASAQERRLLWRRHNRQLWLIGFCLALINLFPPAWLFLPVFSALVFAHFSLEALRQLRAQTVIDAEPNRTRP